MIKVLLNCMFSFLSVILNVRVEVAMDKGPFRRFRSPLGCCEKCPVVNDR